MVARNDICWADLGPLGGRRPVCILTRDAAIAVLTSITVAPLTRTIRGIATEVRLGPDDGLPAECVISCDNVETIEATSVEPRAITTLRVTKRAELDRALRYALDIVY